MKTVRRLLVRILKAALVLGLMAVATLVVEHHVFFPHSVANIDDADDWERLGVDFDRDFPLNQDPPGVASVIDPLESTHPRAKAVIDEEMPDASPEERAIWHAELKRHSPDEIREMLALRHRLSTPFELPAARDIRLSSAETPGPLPFVEAAPALPARESPDALAVIESAIDALQSAEQVVLNNISNANSVGFKRSRGLFGNMPYKQITFPGQIDNQGNPGTTGIALGSGTSLAATQTDISQGRLRHTKQPLDLAIQGDGYFQITDWDRFIYARAGAFGVNAEGKLVTASHDRARLLEPAILTPQDTVQIMISHEGIVSVQQAGQSQLNQLGQIQLARFINPQGLAARGDNLFEQTVASGNPLVSTPGQDGLGEIRQGYLEESNVVVTDELAELRRLREQLTTLRRLQSEFSGTAP
jgi:flagellar basal-body rod protein FlgG